MVACAGLAFQYFRRELHKRGAFVRGSPRRSNSNGWFKVLWGRGRSDANSGFAVLGLMFGFKGFGATFRGFGALDFGFTWSEDLVMQALMLRQGIHKLNDSATLCTDSDLRPHTPHAQSQIQKP